MSRQSHQKRVARAPHGVKGARPIMPVDGAAYIQIGNIVVEVDGSAVKAFNGPQNPDRDPGKDDTSKT